MMSTDKQSASSENAFAGFLKRKWLAILLVVLLLVVAIQNGVADDEATVFLLWAELAVPTWVLILVVFLVGAITGWLFARSRAARKRRR
jgi:putative membrane protein